MILLPLVYLWPHPGQQDPSGLAPVTASLWSVPLHTPPHVPWQDLGALSEVGLDLSLSSLEEPHGSGQIEHSSHGPQGIPVPGPFSPHRPACTLLPCSPRLMLLRCARCLSWKLSPDSHTASSTLLTSQLQVATFKLLHPHPQPQFQPPPCLGRSLFAYSGLRLPDIAVCSYLFLCVFIAA